MRLHKVCSELNLSAETVVLGAIDTGLPVSDRLLSGDVNVKLSDELLRATARELLGEAAGDEFISEVNRKAAQANARREKKREAREAKKRRATKPGSPTNTDAIARIRGVDPVSAAAFWSEVNAAAYRRLSTYEVLVLLREQGARAATVSPQALAASIQPLSASPKSIIQPVASPLPTARAPHKDTQAKHATASPQRPAVSDLQATLARRHSLGPVESEELYGLLAFMAPMGFSTSKQLSNFIVTRQLGRQYPNISGIVRMEQDGREWDFKGGFPPRIYAIVCDELGLRNQGSRARPVGFTPFRDLYQG